MEDRDQKKQILSKERVKDWIRSKMDRGRWIVIADMPHLKQENYLEFVEIVKEMIDEKDYGDQEIYIELDSWHTQLKIFNYSGFYKKPHGNKNAKNAVGRHLDPTGRGTGR